ncbi:MAG: FtsZ-binding cell division protein ZapB, partial [Planctomycetota bacterium]
GIDTWVELRGQIGKERAMLAERKAFLADRIELIRGQIEDTQKRAEARREEVGKSKDQREELEAESETLKAASESLRAIIGPLEAQTQVLLKRMPAPLVEQLRELSQNIPADPENTTLSLSKRFGQVVGILNFIDKFNTDVHVTTETREIMAGMTAQVTALYLGISAGYYVNGAGDRAGRGFATDEAFVWAPVNESALEIQQAVKVLNGELPQFVQVPIVID